MKKWLVFLLGFLAGIAFTIVVALIAAGGSSSSIDGATFLKSQENV